MTDSPFPAPCLAPENLPTAFLLPLPPVSGTVLACLLPDKPVFCAVDHRKPSRAARSSISHGRHVPPFGLCHLAEGRPVLSLCLGCWSSLPSLVPVLGRAGGATLRGLPRLNKESWPQAIHLSGGGADRRLGEPRRGAPVADRFAALEFFAGGRVMHSADRF